MSSPGYTPGVCNIGPAEISLRRKFGHAALAATIILWSGLILIHAPSVARFVVALPAAAAASGYLQAYFHFCANFGWRGVFNMGNQLATPDTVAQAEYRRRDRLKAMQILGLSLLVGIGVGMLAVLFTR